jgi:hypothetical protein
MKIYGRMKVSLHVFLSLALDVGEWSVSQPSHFTSRERSPSTHWRQLFITVIKDLFTYLSSMSIALLKDALLNGQLIMNDELGR